MLKKITPMTKVAALLLGAFFLLNYENNPPNGYTGAPGDNLCTSCHSTGNPGNFGGDISITGLPATVSPGMVYPITLTVTRTQGSPQLAGFQLVALNASNANAGSLSSGSSNPTVQMSGGRTYVEHNPAIAFGANTSVSWNFNWTAPSGPNGAITFYAAANLANGTGGSGGDLIITQTAATTLTGAVTPLSASITFSQSVSCNGGNNGQATVTATNGTPPYSYSWPNGATTAMVTNLTAGNHTVTVTDNAGVTATATVNITQPPVLNLTVVSTTDVTCAGPGSATVSASGGTPGYTYAWPFGGSGPTANNLVSGSHIVTVTDSKGCTKMVTVNINQNTVTPTAQAGTSGQITCTTTQVTVSGSGSSTGANMSYQWTTTNGHIVSGATSLNAVVNAAGTYTLTVLNNQNQCSASSSTTVTANITPPNAVVQQNNQPITCSNPNLTLSGNGSSSGAGITYLWTTTNGHIVSGATSLSPVVNAAGSYTLTVNNTSNGCSASQSVTVGANTTTPGIAVQTPALLTCVTDTIVINGSGSTSGANITYNWTTTTGSIASGANTSSPTVTAPGSYFFTVTNTGNGCANTDTIVVNQNITAPVAAIAQPSTLGCNATLILNGSASSSGANISYQWTTSGGNITAGATSNQATINAPGTYCLEVTNNTNGCSTSTCQSIVQAAPPSVLASSTANVSCANGSNGSAIASVSGGTAPYSFAWSNGATTASISNLEAGQYSVVVTDGNGCSNADTITISEPSPLNANAVATGETSAGANDGTATVNPAGGTNPYTVLWSTGDNSTTINGLSPGTYTVNVTDANGCTTSGSVQVNGFNCAVTVNTTATPVSCFGGADGAVTAQLLGGLGDTEFLWSTGDDTAVVSNLEAGFYGLTATDGNNCQATTVVEVTQPVQLAGQAEALSEGGCDFDGSALVSASGGTGPYTFEWSNGDTLAQTALPVGAFSVSITDANGCQLTVAGSIPQAPDTQAPTAIGQSIQVVLDDQGLANITPQMLDMGSTDACGTVQLSIDVSTFDCEDIGANTVVLTATDAAGNSATDTIEVMVVDQTPPHLLLQEVTLSLNENGVATLTAAQVDAGSSDNCGIAAMTISQSDFTCDDLGINAIALTASDANGLTSVDSVQVTVIDAVAPIVICPENVVSNACEVATTYALPTTADNCGIASLELTAGLPSGVVFPVGMTTVTYQTADHAGNTAICSFIVTIQSDLVITDITAQINCPGEASELTSTVAGGTPPYTYLWSNGDTTPGTITFDDHVGLTVSDAQGCVVISEANLVLPDAIAINGQITPATDSNSDGSIVPFITGGTSPYQLAWSSNGILISTEATLTDVPGGLYLLTVTDASGCSATQEFTVDIITGTNDVDIVNLWNVFPNPFNGYLRIELDLKTAEMVKATLFDLTGRPVATEFAGTTSNWRTDLQLESLPAGLYLLQMQIGEQFIQKKLIKQ